MLCLFLIWLLVGIGLVQPFQPEVFQHNDVCLDSPTETPHDSSRLVCEAPTIYDPQIQTATMTETSDVVIVGGGLSGFTTALFLAREHIRSEKTSLLRLLIIEAKEKVGGRARSTESGIDLGGAWLWPSNELALELRKSLSIEAFRDEACEMGERRLKTGMVTFVDAMRTEIESLDSERIELKVYTSSIVTDVDYSGEEIVVTVSSSPVGSSLKVTCKVVVVAAPPRLVASTMNFRPALTVDRLKAMREQNIWMGATAKVAISYNAKWWSPYAVNNAWLRHPHILQLMDASTQDAHAIVAFAHPPPVDKLPSPGFRISDFENIHSITGLDDTVKEWVKSIVAGIDKLARQMHVERARIRQVDIFSWRHDRYTFATDGVHPAGHQSYFIHPQDGGKILRQPLCDKEGKIKVMFAGSETDDEAAGFLEGAFRAGLRAAQVLNSNKCL
eukprot:Colp12_sorted_trinity150504_noHs@31048